MIVRNIMRVIILATLCVWRYVPGIRHGVTDIRRVATGIYRDPTSIHKDSTHDAVRHGCYLDCHARVLHVFLLFPLKFEIVNPRASLCRLVVWFDPSRQ